jgi:hypothetical protein
LVSKFTFAPPFFIHEEEFSVSGSSVFEVLVSKMSKQMKFNPAPLDGNSFVELSQLGLVPAG